MITATRTPRWHRLASVLVVAVATALLVGACGGDDEQASKPSTVDATETTAAAPNVQLAGVKQYLSSHSASLADFTQEFSARAGEYGTLAEEADGDLRALFAQNPGKVRSLVTDMKRLWVEGNPYYERMEGIVAGTPSLAEFDVVLDAGSSAAEDPSSAVPFDLTLSDGSVLKQPGNLFNLTEGALWGTLDDGLRRPSTPVDLDGDGKVEFGEVLPDPALLEASAQTFDDYAKELTTAGEQWRPTASDAFTSVVVMVPTMSEYFGQWKVSRFVAGNKASSEAFNVVSRLSDIRDILAGLQVVYRGIEPAIASANPAQASQTRKQLGDLRAFVGGLRAREQTGNRFTPEQADTLGTEAQERATAIAGQVSQAAAELGIEIQQ